MNDARMTKAVKGRERRAFFANGGSARTWRMDGGPRHRSRKAYDRKRDKATLRRDHS